MSIARIFGRPGPASIALCFIASAAAFWIPTADAAEIYKCRTETGLLYTDEPVPGGCRRMSFKVTKPDPKAIARLEKRKERWAVEETRKAAEAREERLVRVRELEALAAWQSARAALMDAQAARYCQRFQPVYFPLWTYSVGSPMFHGYSDFGKAPPWHEPDANRYTRYEMPPVLLPFSR